MKKGLNIVIVETSQIVFEGLTNIIVKGGITSNIKWADDLSQVEKYVCSCLNKENIIIINPVFIQNNIKAFQSLKNSCSGAFWLGLVYALHDQEILDLFDDIIRISDSPEKISEVIRAVINIRNNENPEKTEDTLSERETEVLQLLAIGLQNKEIADKLNISINTVITHRKNITQKTGIKTISGLTIYAVVKKIISINHLH